MHVFVFWIVSIWLTVVPADCVGIDEIKANCPTVDYLPCSCTMVLEPVISNYEIICDKVPIAKVKEIFSKTTARHLDFFSLRIAPSETSPIPADLLGSSSSKEISIESAGTYKLLIDDNAFRSSKNKTERMWIKKADFVKQRNLAFLSDFQVITFFVISDSKNIQSLQGLPIGIEMLRISESRDFENITIGPNIVLPRLDYLELNNNRMGNVLTAKMLKTLASSSIDSLVTFSVVGNNLTKVPEMVKSFNKLDILWLDQNDFVSIDTQNFPLPRSLRRIYLNNNNISSIKPHVIQDYTYLELVENKMTRLDSYVFQSLLESLLLKEDFFNIRIYLNPIECDCHLAWLIVHRRDLLTHVEGECSNSTFFQDLNPEGFKNCPVFTCPTDINGNFPSPISCSSYYTCTDGKSTLIECPVGKVFNRSTLKCDVPRNVPTCK